MTTPMNQLLNCLPQRGRVRWLGVRPARGEPMAIADSIEARPGQGLMGDRYAGRGGKREVTLIQFEHLPVIANLLGTERVRAQDLRRNIVVSGINILALRQQRFEIGSAVLEGVDFCHPCSKMEAMLGPGGYNAVRGHGGITARVIRAGVIRLGDQVRMLPPAPELAGPMDHRR